MMRRRSDLYESYPEYFLKRWAGPAMLVIVVFVIAFVFFWVRGEDEIAKIRRWKDVTAYQEMVKNKAAEAAERGAE